MTQLFDWTLPLNELKRSVFRFKVDFESSNKLVLFDIYDGLINSRHDLFQYFFYRSLGLPWKEEIPLADVLPVELPPEYSRKTPDFVFIKGSQILIIDFSVSIDTHTNALKKENKYKPICDYINSIGEYEASFFHVNIRSDFKNIHNELQSLPIQYEKDFEVSDFIQLVQCIDDKKVELGSYFDPTEFNEHKQKKYGLGDSELLETNIGQYKDLTIDLEGFKDYNQKFEHYDKIKKAHESCKITDLKDFLKGVLENKDSPIHKKYADLILTEEQFDYAHDQIVHKNQNAPKTTPHPSHHLLIPQPEDVFCCAKEGVMSDHDSLESMAKDFLIHYTKNKSMQTDDKLSFIASFFKAIEDKNNSPDFKILDGLFRGSDGPHKVAATEYKLIKRLRQYVNIFQKAINYSKDKHIKKISKEEIFNPSRNYPKVTINKAEFSDCQLDFSRDDNQRCWEEFFRSKKIVLENKGVNNLTSYMCHTGLITRDPSEMNCWVIGNKKIKMPKDKQPQLVKLSFEKAGIKTDVEKKDRTPKKEREAIPLETYKEVDKIIERFLFENWEPTNYKLHGFLITKPSKADSPEAYRMKKECQFNYLMFAEQLMSTNAYNYSHNLSLAYASLSHINDFKSKNDTVMAFNMGLENFCCLVALTHNNTEGKPFLSILKTKNPDLYSGFFGQVYKHDIGNGYYYVISNWRRLSSEKLMYLRDVHTSVFSSTMNSAMSSPIAYKYLSTDRLRRVFSLRVLIGYSVNQKTSELLLDTRYAYMSALSKYTNIGKLLVEKFGYNFYTIMEAWIINRLITRLKKINHGIKMGGISDLRVTIDGNIRDVSSIGGIIDLPGLWVDYNLKDITELLDEAFLYVHTIKEPSNIFHEQIKAIQTIVKFQMDYDSSPEYIKDGCIDTPQKLEAFLIRPGYIGCCAPLIIDSVNKTIVKENHGFKKYVHELNDESIGEIMTTKAVIADEEREVIADIPMTKRDIKKLLRRQEDVVGTMSKEEKIKYLKYRYKTHSKFYNETKPRQRVWETIIDHLENSPKIEKTVDLANQFLINPKVIADICIKSQYGSKREFYVVNITAKALARITECFFKKVSEKSPNEAISIPGDKKVVRMQGMLDRVHSTLKEYSHEIIYTNGDCTKWSAAETMQSFIAMTHAFKPYIPDGLFNVLLATFNAWSSKEIQVPLDIFNKVVPTEKYNTDFLIDMKQKQFHSIKSTQNFLQGMFNYASSYKAVCCTNYAYSLWQEFYPSSNFKVEHLEHSDDYVLVCLYEKIEDFEKFRVLQKMVMRIHGFNDSDRKTCSQEHIMEFVSQMSYNGVMLYPQIKKSKEVNLSLPCTGYTKDMDAALSRVGECQRVGCNISYLYFFQRLHIYHLAYSYSVLPGQKNNMDRDFEQLFNYPCELFGLPDPLPLFSTFCTGSINNYRLYKYGDNNIRKKLQFLYKRSGEISNLEGLAVEGNDDRYCLATPRFLYDMGNRSLQKLKKNLNIKLETIKDFWSKHPVYKVLKPKTSEDLVIWAKSMFYNRTFMEAYSKTSRSKMTLRLAKYVNSKIISERVTLEDHSESLYKWGERLFTIRDYFDKMVKDLENYLTTWDDNDEKHLIRILTKCDPTVSNVYSIIQNITMSITDIKRSQTVQVACPSPAKQSTIFLVNDPPVVLQYIMDKENFIKDNRRVISRYSLEKDVCTVIDKYSRELEESKENPMALLSVYNDLMINKCASNIIYTYDRKSVGLQDFIISTLQNNYHPGVFSRVTITNRCTIIDPTTLGLLFEKQHRYTKDYHRQCLDNICLLHVYFTHYLKLKTPLVLETMKNILFDTMDGHSKNCFQILEDLNTNYMNMYGYNIHERKIQAYLDLYYNNNISSMMELINTNYAFSYKYNERAVPKGGVYYGLTVVTYTHFNTTIKAYHNQEYGDPIVVSNKHFPSISPMLYNVALRLTNSISENEFSNNNTLDRRRLIKGEMLLEKIKQLGLKSVNKVVKPMGENDRLVKLCDIKPEDNYWPILITNKILTRETGSHFSKIKAYPTLENESLLVKLGKSKLYVLPYWKCTQFDNVKLIRDYDYGVPLSVIMRNRRLEYFLTKPSKLKFDKFELPSKKTIELVGIIEETIRKTKLYNFNFSTIVDNCEPIEEFLDAPGRGHLEKTFLKSIFKEPIKKEIYDFPTTYKSNDYDFVVENEEGDMYWDVNQDFEPGELLYNAIGEDDIIDDLGEIVKEGLLYHNREMIGEDMVITQRPGAKVEDTFSIDPRTTNKRTTKQKKFEFYSSMGTNYMVLRLNYLPNMYYHFYSINNNINTEYDLLTMHNLRESLQNLSDCFDYILQNEEEMSMPILNIFIMLERLLCKTYITDKIDEKQIVGFGYNEKTIVLGTWVNISKKLTEEQITKAIECGKIIERKNDWALIKCTVETYKRNVTDGLRNGLLQQQIPYASPQNHKFLMSLNTRINQDKNYDLIRDLMI